MYLTNTTETLQVILAGAVTTNQSVVTVDYGENTATTFVAGKQRSTTNGTTAVNILNAPASANTQRIVQLLTMTNQDTAPITVTIRTNDGGTLGTQFGPVTLQVGERIQFATDTGFTVYTLAGAVKVTAVASTVEPGYIDGCQMIWNSGTSLSVSSGSAYIPSVGANVNIPATITKAGLALAVSTMYHVYVFLNAGVPDAEVVTTAPASPYNGVARAKTGDPTRRYVGSVLTDAAGAIYDFVHVVTSGRIMYQTNVSPAPFLVLSGNAAVATSVSTSGVVPITSRLASCPITNNDAAVTVHFGNSSFPPTSTAFMERIEANRTLSTDLVLNGAQAFQYMFTVAPAGNVVIRVKGYYFDR